MRFTTFINNKRCMDWGLNANQGALFDLINQAAGRALIAVVMAAWVLCTGVSKDAKDAVRFLRDSYRDGMKQAEERRGEL